jgi:hypothetical protein
MLAAEPGLAGAELRKFVTQTPPNRLEFHSKSDLRIIIIL